MELYSLYIRNFEGKSSPFNYELAKEICASQIQGDRKEELASLTIDKPAYIFKKIILSGAVNSVYLDYQGVKKKSFKNLKYSIEDSKFKLVFFIDDQEEPFEFEFDYGDLAYGSDSKIHNYVIQYIKQFESQNIIDWFTIKYEDDVKDNQSFNDLLESDDLSDLFDKVCSRVRFKDESPLPSSLMKAKILLKSKGTLSRQAEEFIGDEEFLELDEQIRFDLVSTAHYGKKIKLETLSLAVESLSSSLRFKWSNEEGRFIFEDNIWKKVLKSDTLFSSFAGEMFFNYLTDGGRHDVALAFVKSNYFTPEFNSIVLFHPQLPLKIISEILELEGFPGEVFQKFVRVPSALEMLSSQENFLKLYSSAIFPVSKGALIYYLLKNNSSKFTSSDCEKFLTNKLYKESKGIFSDLILEYPHINDVILNEILNDDQVPLAVKEEYIEQNKDRLKEEIVDIVNNSKDIDILLGLYARLNNRLKKDQQILSEEEFSLYCLSIMKKHFIPTLAIEQYLVDGAVDALGLEALCEEFWNHPNCPPSLWFDLVSFSIENSSSINSELSDKVLNKFLDEDVLEEGFKDLFDALYSKVSQEHELYRQKKWWNKLKNHPLLGEGLCSVLADFEEKLEWIDNCQSEFALERFYLLLADPNKTDGFESLNVDQRILLVKRTLVNPVCSVERMRNTLSIFKEDEGEFLGFIEYIKIHSDAQKLKLALTDILTSHEMESFLKMGDEVVEKKFFEIYNELPVKHTPSNPKLLGSLLKRLDPAIQEEVKIQITSSYLSSIQEKLEQLADSESLRELRSQLGSVAQYFWDEEVIVEFNYQINDGEIKSIKQLYLIVVSKLASNLLAEKLRIASGPDHGEKMDLVSQYLVDDSNYLGDDIFFKDLLEEDAASIFPEDLFIFDLSIKDNFKRFLANNVDMAKVDEDLVVDVIQKNLV